MDFLAQLHFANNTFHRLRSDEAQISRIVEMLADVHVLRDLHFIKPEGGKKGRLVRVADWSAIPPVPQGYIHVADAASLDAASKVLELKLAFDTATLSIRSPANPAAALNELTDAIEKLLPTLNAASLRLGPWSGVRVLELSFPEPRPPRDLGRLPADAVFDVLDTKSSANLLGKLAQALKTDPPENAQAREEGGYVIVDWLGGTPATAESLSAAMSDRLACLYERLRPPTASGYNESGDHEVTVFNPERHPFYTLYTPFDGTAFKALTAEPGRLKEHEDVLTIIGDLRKGSTSDGKKLTAVTLILPTRDLALQHRPEALQLGFKATVYPDNQGQFWNPHPGGNWSAQ